MYAKPQSLKYNNNTFNYNERNIDYHYVRPLVIRDVIVKAKKKWGEAIRIIDNNMQKLISKPSFLFWSIILQHLFIFQ